MTGFFVEAVVLGHPRFKAAGGAASWLWTQGGIWSASEGHDGFVSLLAVKAYGTLTQARKLVEVELWEEVDGGFRFLRWRNGRPTPESVVEERRRKDRERKRVRRTADISADISADSADISADIPRNVRGHEVPLDIPSSNQYPPYPPTGGEAEAAAPSPKRTPVDRGERLPEPFMVSREMREWAAAEVPNVDVDVATRSFVDYWRAVPGVRGRKLDWVSTWRNSLRAGYGVPRTTITRPAERPAPTLKEIL